MKTVSCALFLGLFAGISNASANIVKVEDYDKEIKDVATCTYQYDSTNCISPRSLQGFSCRKDGHQYYQYCKCPSDYKICEMYRRGDGGSCTDEDGDKYERCLCDQDYYGSNSSNCTGELSGESCFDETSDESGYWTGCNGITDCTGYIACTGNGQVGNTACPADSRLFFTCECLGEYNETSCPSPKIYSDVCRQQNSNVVTLKYKDCKCPDEYNRTCANTCPNGSGGWKAADVCGRLGACDGRYAHCGEEIGACSAGMTLYRLNSNGRSWYSSGESEYPPFVCSASTGATISVFCKENGGGCIEEISSNVNGSPESTKSVPESDYTYEKAGIMLNDTVAVALIESPEYLQPMTYVSPWIGASTDEHNVYNTTIASGSLSVSYNNNLLCTAPESCSGITGILHTLSSGVTSGAYAGTETSANNPVGSRNTYNYTFGVPYYKKDSHNRITNSGEINSTYLGSLSNGDTGDSKGIVAPAWYCMRHNIEGMSGYDGFFMIDNNAANGQVSRSFADGQKVYYYLPTVGDWGTFNTYVSTHPGFVANTLKFGNRDVSMWSSSLTTANDTPYVYRYTLHSGQFLPTKIEQNGNNDDGPYGTTCFIYVSGYTPSGSCTVTLSGKTISLTGSACTAQSN